MAGVAVGGQTDGRMSRPPITPLAFAAGATLLQWQANLPPVAAWLAASAALAFFAVVLHELARRWRAPRTRPRAWATRHPRQEPNPRWPPTTSFPRLPGRVKP